ncbi:hypothetical protein Golob_015453 [Gossypium lobatum]|uniref:RNase H type-1 domain-containing protein n=1 Tax=Gossypium lobatum TaxID=34289 RepID=A0A7J8M182_9ROSI|nr:hypothetical protein [Gossypium lobatum]
MDSGKGCYSIIGLNRQLGKCSIFDAELQGILDGLSIL